MVDTATPPRRVGIEGRRPRIDDGSLVVIGLWQGERGRGQDSQQGQENRSKIELHLCSATGCDWCFEQWACEAFIAKSQTNESRGVDWGLFIWVAAISSRNEWRPSVRRGQITDGWPGDPILTLIPSVIPMPIPQRGIPQSGDYQPVHRQLRLNVNMTFLAEYLCFLGGQPRFPFPHSQCK